MLDDRRGSPDYRLLLKNSGKRGRRQMRLRAVAAIVLQITAVSVAHSQPTAGKASVASPTYSAEVKAGWLGADGKLVWPPNDGFSGPPVLLVLPPGMLLDRFGFDTGYYFSPRGAGFEERALPYICSGLHYTAYRVLKPVLGWAGHAAPWFGERGGATQIETDASAAQMVADHILEPVDLPPSVACPGK